MALQEPSWSHFSLQPIYHMIPLVCPRAFERTHLRDHTLRKGVLLPYRSPFVKTPPFLGIPSENPSEKLWKPIAKHLILRTLRRTPHGMGCPRSTVEKGPRAMRAMRVKTLESRTISTVLWVHRRRLPQTTVKAALPSHESYESKTGCNRTPATVLGFHWWKHLQESPENPS